MYPRPLIGITANLKDNLSTLAKGYYKAVSAAGGIPVIIPPLTDYAACSRLLETVDGLLLSGGPDIDPAYFGQELHPSAKIDALRDKSEMMLVKAAVERCMPVLGICRGIQMLTVAMGGDLYQDMSLFPNNAEDVHHSPVPPCDDDMWHMISVKPDSLVGSLIAQKQIMVNSYHHQTVDKLPCELIPVAWSPDGAIEAVESDVRPIIGVQWHPERMLQKGNTQCLSLFDWLVQQSGLYSRARSFHKTHIVLDSHCDTPMLFQNGTQFAERGTDALVTLDGMRAGYVDASFMVAYIPQKERSAQGLIDAGKMADHILDLIEEQVLLNRDHVVLASLPSQIASAKQAGKKIVVRGIENGYAIAKDLSLLKHFKSRGVTYITLCHNGDNDICDSAKGNNEHGGLSSFGRQVVAEMNRLGLMVDLSHAGEKSFWDVLECSSAPVFCSHSSCRSLCDHARNLSDAQIKSLAQNGGVMQICMYGGFLENDETKANVHSAVKHIMHAVEVAGIDHVGIGTDMDGGGGVPGLDNISAAVNLTRLLMEQGFSTADLEKIWGGNLLSFWNRVISCAEPCNGL